MSESDVRLATAITVAFFVVGVLFGGVLFNEVSKNTGHHEACASIQAEWRDGKCVRVVVEDVK